MKYNTDYKSEKYKPGAIYPSQYGELEIMGKGEKENSFVIRFKKTGSFTTALSSNIKRGNVKDKFSPIRYGVGYLGDDAKIPPSPLKNKIYTLWNNILRRCYGETYDRYGNIRRTYADVSVAPRWFDFSVFFNDIKKLPNYTTWLKDSNYEIDKDKSGARIYSKDTCSFITREENTYIGHE